MTYNSGSRKVGYDEYIGWVSHTREVEIMPNLFKTETKAYKVWNAEGRNFSSDTTARRWAKRAMINLITEGTE